MKTKKAPYLKIFVNNFEVGHSSKQMRDTLTKNGEQMRLEIKSLTSKRRAIKGIIQSAAQQLIKTTTRPNMSDLQFETAQDAELFDFIRKINIDNSILKGSTPMSPSEVILMKRICNMQRLEGVNVSCLEHGGNLVITST